MADPVRVLQRELAAAQDRGQRPDRPFRVYFRNELEEIVTRGVRVRIIGNRSRVATDIRQMIEEMERRTVDNTGLNLTFAFDYGGQEEIAGAARELARAAKEGRLDPETITPELFADAPLHQRAARARPRHPHQRRAAPEQLPAVAVGLRGAALCGHAVAGFRRRNSSKR